MIETESADIVHGCTSARVHLVLAGLFASCGVVITNSASVSLVNIVVMLTVSILNIAILDMGMSIEKNSSALNLVFATDSGK